MKKIILVCTLALFLGACTKSPNSTAIVAEPTPDPYTHLPTF